MLVRFSEPAQADLFDILTYIAQDNTVAALEVVDEIERWCLTTLAENPKIGTKFESSAFDLRIFPKRSYNIFYRITDEHIEVVRVLHHARLASNILKG